MSKNRNSNGYRKDTSSNGRRHPYISEKTAGKIDIIAKHKGINFTKACEEALDQYADSYIKSLDIIEQQELLKLLWDKV